jgi:predicted MPP superfamily phosphohydrolase
MSFVSRAEGAPTPKPKSISRRSFLYGASALGVGMAGYAATFGRHDLQIVQRTFPIANLPDPFVGFRIVQISDIHLEEFTETWFLEHIVAQTNALNPDLVLLTGDFISKGPRSDEFAWKCAGICAEILSGLKAPQRYGSLGNHDQGVGPEHVIAPLQAHGTPMIVDTHVAIERGSDRLWLCGTEEATAAPNFASTVPADPRAPVILMCHEPDLADVFLPNPLFAKVDLMLSGHSHGGQIRLPFIGPLVLPPMGKKYVEGNFQVGRTQLYVNSGVGTVGLPFRFDCPPEITHITLTRA